MKLDIGEKQIKYTQFFFGSTVYDDWYYEDLIDTIKICNDIIENENIKEIYYQSSW